MQEENTDITHTGDELFVDENDQGEVIDAEAIGGDVPIEDEDDIAEEHQRQQEEEEGTEPVIPFVDDSKARFEGHEPGKSVFCVALNPKVEHIVATGGEDNAAFLWDGRSGEILSSLEPKGESIIAIEFNHDGQLVAAADMDGVIDVCEPEGTLVQRLEAGDEVTCIKWHPRGNCLIAGTVSGMVWMWMIPNGAILTFVGHEDAVNSVQFAPDGKSFVSVSDDGTLIKWNPKTGEQEFKTDKFDDRFHKAPISTVAIHPTINLIATGGRNGTLRFTNSTSGKLISGIDDFEDSVESIVFCPELNMMAAGSVDGNIKIYNTPNFSRRAILQHDDAVTKLVFSRNPQTKHVLYSSSMDSKIKKWDVRSGELLHTWNGHQGGVLDFAVAADGETVVTASDDGTAAVFYPQAVADAAEATSNDAMEEAGMDI